MEPAVYAIAASETVLGIIWLPSFDGASPRGQYSRSVIGMSNAGDGPTFQLVKGLAKIVQGLLTDEFDFTSCRPRINKAGNAINDQAKTLFARAQGFLGALSVFKSARRMRYSDSYG